MADVTSNDPPKDPDFISYLLSPELSDCFFVVGNENLIEPERIGVVRKMLCAHSTVLRAELYESKNAEKGTVYVEDLYPDTFKHLLRFFYGYDNTKSLGFDEADNLLYAAEKYMVETLKGRLATRLADLLTCDNICTLLNNPACFRTLEAKTALTRLLQNETDKVLTSPQFLDLTTDAFLKILEQEAMNVPELHVWRAALKWAKHQIKSDDREALRGQLKESLKHIRVCTLDAEDLCREVVPAGILTDIEFNMVCLSKTNQESQAGLVTISNEIVSRKRVSKYKVLYSHQYQSLISDTEEYQASTATLEIITKDCALELYPLVFRGKKSTLVRVPQGLKYECQYTITITRVTDFVHNTSTETPLMFETSGEFEYGKEIKASLATEGKNTLLLPKSKYIIKVNFSETIPMFLCKENKIHDRGNYYVSVYPMFQGNHRYIIPFERLSFDVLKEVNP